MKLCKRCGKAMERVEYSEEVCRGIRIPSTRYRVTLMRDDHMDLCGPCEEAEAFGD